MHLGRWSERLRSPAGRRSAARLGAAAGLLALLALRPEGAPAGTAAGRPAPVAVVATSLVLSAQAERFLELQSRAFATEFIGCMIGEVQGHTALVRRIAPADVDPAQSTLTHVVPRQSCEGAGWTGTVAVIHSHPSAERCWYLFPGTEVLSSDGQSFLFQPYAVDAILCGHRVVWINRRLEQRQLPFGPREQGGASSRGGAPQRGNLVQGASASAPGE